jgi:hypothetical protein
MIFACICTIWLTDSLSYRYPCVCVPKGSCLSVLYCSIHSTSIMNLLCISTVMYSNHAIGGVLGKKTSVFLYHTVDRIVGRIKRFLWSPEDLINKNLIYTSIIIKSTLKMKFVLKTSETKMFLKETVSRDFRPPFFFINRWPLGPW